MVPADVVPVHVVPADVVPAPLGGAAGRGRGHPGKLTGADLVSYTSCAQMLRQVKAEALEEVVALRPPGCQRRCPGCAGADRGPRRRVIERRYGVPADHLSADRLGATGLLND